LARPERIAAIQPLIAKRLLFEAIRTPVPTFSLFTWLNARGVVTDWLIAGLADVAPFDDLAERLNLSRSYLTRKLRKAEAMASLGWLGELGKSIMWVSADFRGEYLAQQSEQLAVIDEAFHEVIEGATGG
jgi:AraC-like DNA-binding protein